ncbi:DUF4184 family protein [Microbacterium sp. NPDC057407]|uniref:DUF4184 family protein n=1 Tax=Microbacterium sp. NPDC057407 TaxID=3346120 RepID=UPI00366A85FB
MPFTPSHAVVALPFVRTPLVPAAIAVGAMAPDLPLFVRFLPLGYGLTHDVAWLGATTVLALVLLLVWRTLLRPAIRELSPRALAERLPVEWDAGAPAAFRETFAVLPAAGLASQRWRVSWGGLVLLAVSLALGVVSHIVWDLFTHEGRWGVAAIPALAEEWGALPGYKWLQHGSSVIGLAVLGVWMMVWLSRRDATGQVARVLPHGVRWAWWASLPVVLLVAWAGGLAVLGPIDSDFTVAHLAYRVLPPACAAWGLATAVLCAAVQRRRTARANVSTRS